MWNLALWCLERQLLSIKTDIFVTIYKMVSPYIHQSLWCWTYLCQSHEPTHLSYPIKISLTHISIVEGGGWRDVGLLAGGREGAQKLSIWWVLYNPLFIYSTQLWANDLKIRRVYWKCPMHLVYCARWHVFRMCELTCECCTDWSIFSVGKFGLPFLFCEVSNSV